MTTRVVAAITAALAVALPVARPAHADGTHPALDSLAGCVRSEGTLAVEVLVDESGSLKKTDPHADRAAGVEAAVRNLAALAVVGTKVQVQLSVFSVEHRVLVPFAPLNSGSVDRFGRAAQRLAQLNHGIDTDFAAALTAARTALARRPEKCRSLLLFTDGDYDLQPGSSRGAKSYAPGIRPTNRAAADQLERFGRNLLCRAEGTADQLRVDNTTLLVVPLTTGISPADQGFLRAIANGKGESGATCGTRGSATTGAYLPAGRFGELLGVFDDLTAQLAGGTKLRGDKPLRACARTACPTGTRTFDIDPGIVRFHVLVDLGISGLEVELTPPRAPPVAMKFGGPGTNKVGAVQIRHVWLSPSAVSADVTLPPGGAGVGRWRVTVIDRSGGKAGSLANVQVHVYGDLGARLQSQPKVTIGQQSSLEVALVDGRGTPLTPGNLVRRVQILAQVTDPATGQTTELGRVEPDQTGRAHVLYDVPADLSAGSVTLSLTTTVTTPSGLVLAPTISTTALQVRPPADFPAVTPAALKLGAITAQKPKVADLVIRGGATSAGCVWVESVTADALPPAAGRILSSFEPRADSRSGCLRVKAGEVRTLHIKLSPEHSASGPVKARLKLRLVSDAAPQELTQSVPVQTELLLPVKQGERLGLFILLLAIGLAVPFLMLYIANALSARFADVEFLRSLRVPVRIGGDDVISRLDQPTQMLTVRTDEFRNVPTSEARPMHLEAAGLTFRRVLPRLPVRIPYAMVEASGRPVTSSGGHSWRGHTYVGCLTLQLAGGWVFVLNREAEEGVLEGDLYLFIGDSAIGARPDDVVDLAIRAVPLMRSLANDAATREPARPEAPKKDSVHGFPTGPLNDPLTDPWSQPLDLSGTPRRSDDLPPPPSF